MMIIALCRSISSKTILAPTTLALMLSVLLLLSFVNVAFSASIENSSQAIAQLKTLVSNTINNKIPYLGALYRAHQIDNAMSAKRFRLLILENEIALKKIDRVSRSITYSQYHSITEAKATYRQAQAIYRSRRRLYRAKSTHPIAASSNNTGPTTTPQQPASTPNGNNAANAIVDPNLPEEIPDA